MFNINFLLSKEVEKKKNIYLHSLTHLLHKMHIESIVLSLKDTKFKVTISSLDVPPSAQYCRLVHKG